MSESLAGRPRDGRRRPPAPPPAQVGDQGAHGPDRAHADRVGRAFGHPVGDVDVRDDADAHAVLRPTGAPAAAFGSTIYVDRSRLAGMDSLERDVVWAHEIAHVIQHQHGGGSGDAEGAADDAALAVAGRLRGGTARVPTQPRVGLQLHTCRNHVQEALDGSRPFTADLARQALDKYRSMSAADRDRAVARYYPTGAYHRLLRALPPADASGAYAAVTRDMLQRVQRLAARRHAAGQGLANQAAMAQTQATMMHQQNVAAARAAHGPAPTPSQVASEQRSQVSRTSIAPSSSALTASQVASWTTRANAAVTRIVAHARANHPELNLSAADFHVDVVGIENRGARVVAYGSVVGGRNVCVVGRPFVRLVDRNPAYAMSVVVHELHGHPEYGRYGAAGTEYGLELYDQAAGRMPGYTRPTGAGRRSEIDAYAYQETEIYSLLRSMRYHTAPTAADAALRPYSIDPASTVAARILIIKRQWTPKVAQSLLRGLYQRLRHDPRIDATALAAFAQGVRAAYTGAEASIATAVLR